MKIRIGSETPLQAEGGTRNSDLDLYYDVLYGAHRPAMMRADRGWHPPADLYETDEGLVIRVDIAGVSIEDINLVLEKQTLTLTGVRREPEGEQRRQYHKMEVPYGPFELMLKLPCTVCGNTPRAEYRAGFLTIHLKKKEKPSAKKRRINVQ